MDLKTSIHDLFGSAEHSLEYICNSICVVWGQQDALFMGKDIRIEFRD